MPASKAAIEVTPDGGRRGPSGHRPADRASAPWLDRADLRILAKLPLSTALAWLLPPRGWEVAARLSAGRPGVLDEKIGRILGRDWSGQPVAEIARDHRRMLRMDQLAYLRCHAPWGWRPKLSLHGTEHLDAALRAGRGAILWVAPTVAGPLAAKMALHGNGIAVHHLSHPHHGFSRTSRIGQRLLNPLRTRVEDRFLCERVSLGAANQSQAALRRLSSLLRQGKIVSITVGPRGSRTVAAAFRAGRLEVASGAPALAARTGAALLPVWAWRREDGSYATRIEPALAPASDHHLVVEALAGQLERFVRGHPEQIQWDHSSIQPVDTIDGLRPGGLA